MYINNTLGALIEDQMLIYLKSLPPIKPQWPNDVREAVLYIYNNLFDEDLTVDSLIKEHNYNRASFSGRFRYYVGLGPKKFIDTHRHALAVRLFDVPNIKIVDVAIAIGFRSHHAFTLSFRRYHSCSPSEYVFNKNNNNKAS